MIFSSLPRLLFTATSATEGGGGSASSGGVTGGLGSVGSVSSPGSGANSTTVAGVSTSGSNSTINIVSSDVNAIDANEAFGDVAVTAVTNATNSVLANNSLVTTAADTTTLQAEEAALINNQQTAGLAINAVSANANTALSALEEANANTAVIASNATQGALSGGTSSSQPINTSPTVGAQASSSKAMLWLTAAGVVIGLLYLFKKK